ncbi:transposase-like protein [Azospirillum sp. OGB3]|uniref:hypothetical protein n=1 Tax=Azospirillum sp. OGB3 TaxID=2587012 RepID=UPI001605E88B|nr:hypothetical protein [Azospirillum sp. OGB3]MBB3265182.1 transposase-like protein [Azospirillum sp. OGB3]
MEETAATLFRENPSYDVPALSVRVDRRIGENKGLEQDRRGVKGRGRPMRGFKEFGSADRFCRACDEARNVLRPTATLTRKVSPAHRRAIHARRVAALPDLISAARHSL